MHGDPPAPTALVDAATGEAWLVAGSGQSDPGVANVTMLLLGTPTVDDPWSPDFCRSCTAILQLVHKPAANLTVYLGLGVSHTWRLEHTMSGFLVDGAPLGPGDSSVQAIDFNATNPESGVAYHYQGTITLLHQASVERTRLHAVDALPSRQPSQLGAFWIPWFGDLYA